MCINLFHRSGGIIVLSTSLRGAVVMKMTFIVCNSYKLDLVMTILNEHAIDYYTSWENAKGKGHGTEPHLGVGSYSSTNAVTMIAFEDDAPLEALIRSITTTNQGIQRAADHIRLFQMPLERIV